MDYASLIRLLREPEGPTLEFKRAWYPIGTGSPDSKRHSRDELIKDVLSLANGSPVIAGHTAHLVFGASDTTDDDGSRQIFDAIDFGYDAIARQVMQLVGAACMPALNDLTFDVIKVEGKRLGVLTVHPTAHVHETTRDLSTVCRNYSERTVFIRSGDSIRVASEPERTAIKRHKRHRLKGHGYVLPIAYGAVLGSMLGAISGVITGQATDSTTAGRVASVIVSSVVFALVGLAVGWAASQVLEIRRDWYRIPRWAHWMIAVLLIALSVWVGFVFFGQIMR